MVAAGASVILATLFHIRKQDRFSLAFLLIAALLAFSFAAILDPFLNLWDERFHALVAKNMMSHPWKPTLYEQMPVDMAYDRWDRMHIWLHKQPLFMWQMALSMKIFGTNEFALRLPSVLLMGATTFAAYRTGKILINRDAGFFAALLIITSTYLIELTSGFTKLGQNDITFLAYISLSLWSLVEYRKSGKKKWLIWIGVFSGAAILCKWLVGLMVYLTWGFLKLLEKDFKKFRGPLLALAVTLAVAAPWQIFIMLAYPEEAAASYAAFSKHFWVAVEGHKGGFWFHFEQMNVIYGPLVLVLIVPAFIAFVFSSRDRKLSAALTATVVFVYFFFSFAKTKMPSFSVVLVLPMLLAIAALLEFIVRWVRSNKWRQVVFAVFVIGVVAWRFDIESIQKKHTEWKAENLRTPRLTENKANFQKIALPENAVLFNVAGRTYIEAMFYRDVVAYGFIPTLEQLEQVRKAGMVPVVIDRGKPLPDYLGKEARIIEVDIHSY